MPIPQTRLNVRLLRYYDNCYHYCKSGLVLSYKYGKYYSTSVYKESL